MNYSRKAHQWEDAQLNKHLNSIDEEDDNEDEGVYNDDFDYEGEKS